MEFANRNVQSQAATPGAPNSAAANQPKKSKSSNQGKWGKIGVVVATLLVAILLIAVLIVAVKGPKTEDSYVDSSKLQAVFLNTGQVYFGNIKTLNSKYFVVTNIYYLQTANSGSSTAANSNVSLVKLGCELHEPYDQMVINRDQVTFWENLQDNGQVATAVSTFKKNNPNGQKCADQSSSAGTSSGGNVQSAGSNSTDTPAATTNKQ